MKTTLLSFSALAWINIWTAAPDVAEAKSDYFTKPSLQSAEQVLGSHTDQKLQVARNGHGGDEDLYFNKKHRDDRNAQSR